MALATTETLFALDCGATNWRLFRSIYKRSDEGVRLIGEPQTSPLTSFIERKLPAVLYLNPACDAIESFGELARIQLENEKNRERTRDYFKPCIGSHLRKRLSSILYK